MIGGNICTDTNDMIAIFRPFTLYLESANPVNDDTIITPTEEAAEINTVLIR